MKIGITPLCLIFPLCGRLLSALTVSCCYQQIHSRVVSLFFLQIWTDFIGWYFIDIFLALLIQVLPIILIFVLGYNLEFMVEQYVTLNLKTLKTDPEKKETSNFHILRLHKCISNNSKWFKAFSFGKNYCICA